MAFELTATGLETPRFPEARELVVAEWKANFGANAQTASDTPDGLIIDTIALLTTLLWEGVGAVHANSYFRSAVGTNLDQVLALFGRRRLEALASTVSAIWYGDASTAVDEGSIASVEDTGDRFATDVDATTVADGAGGPHVVRINVAADGETYGVDTDGSESTIVAGVSSTVDTIADALVTAIAADEPTYTVTRAGNDPDGAALIVLEGTGADTVAVGGSTTTPANLDVLNGVAVAMTAEQTGPTTALANTLNTIETSIAGIDGVITIEDAEVGRAEENNPDFRARHLDRLNSGGFGTPEAIRARILEKLEESVEFVRVFENETDTIDADGRPPHSFEVVWIGEVGAATELAVAQQILLTKPAGIQAYGDIVNNIADAGGTLRSIGSSRGTELFLWLDVTIVEGEGYPTTGDPLGAIEAAIVEYLTPGGDGELELGDDFYRFSLGAPINLTVPGVASATITTGTTPNEGDPMPALSAADITVDPDAILRVASTRISVHT